MKPDHLYKYRFVDEFLRKTLVDHEMWFATYDTFNDPFDCAPVPTTKATLEQFKEFQRRVAKEQYPDATRQQLRKHIASNRKFFPITQAMLGKPEGDAKFKEILESQLLITGMYCMTADPTNILMWSHYANKHTGVCLRFDGYAFEAYPVVYNTERPVVNFITQNKEMIDHAVFRKSKLWEYEQEWRIILRKASGAIKYVPRAVTGVILGARISGEDEQKVRDWVSDGKMNVTFERARLDPHEFKMDLIPA